MTFYVYVLTINVSPCPFKNQWWLLEWTTFIKKKGQNRRACVTSLTWCCSSVVEIPHTLLHPNEAMFPPPFFARSRRRRYTWNRKITISASFINMAAALWCWYKKWWWVINRSAPAVSPRRLQHQQRQQEYYEYCLLRRGSLADPGGGSKRGSNFFDMDRAFCETA